LKISFKSIKHPQKKRSKVENPAKGCPEKDDKSPKEQQGGEKPYRVLKKVYL